jgi:hypothetical protein
MRWRFAVRSFRGRKRLHEQQPAFLSTSTSRP